MRSRDADRYDLDADAVDYDTRVADEQVLIRRGYAACLRALSEDLSRAPTPDGPTSQGPTSDAPTSDALPVTDLGAGTGTLLRALRPPAPPWPSPLPSHARSGLRKTRWPARHLHP